MAVVPVFGGHICGLETASLACVLTKPVEECNRPGYLGFSVLSFSVRFHSITIAYSGPCVEVRGLEVALLVLIAPPYSCKGTRCEVREAGRGWCPVGQVRYSCMLFCFDLSTTVWVGDSGRVRDGQRCLAGASCYHLDVPKGQ